MPHGGGKQGPVIAGALELVLGLLFGDLLAASARRRQLRRWEDARERGLDVAFAGFARGPVPYRPAVGDAGGMLVLSSGELFWTADAGLGRALWHRVPTQRLVVTGRTRGPGSSGGCDWPGYECLDGDRVVVLLCEPDAEQYLRAALHLPSTSGA